MRETSPRGWHRWRNAAVKSPPASLPPSFGRMTRPAPPPAEPHSPSVPTAGEDGIRHELVERVRREIAAGTYDTEEKWLLAEEALLRRVTGCA
ncbi:MAG: hypothetical protein K2V38_15580 [Gemmataceae bacterium]|nr:hypothetical protein [Gemmataceae bacterium]